jgi:hypothetical protein
MPFLGFEMLGVTEVDQRIQVPDAFKPDIAAASAIASVGAAKFHVFFTTKTFAAGAAVTAFYKNFSFIKEFHRRFFQKQKPASVRRAVVELNKALIQPPQATLHRRPGER